MPEPTIQSLQDTNSRLNRRCQQLESVVAQKKEWEIGYQHGCDTSWDAAYKHYEKRLANYKHGTRRRMLQLEKDNSAYIAALRKETKGDTNG